MEIFYNVLIFVLGYLAGSLNSALVYTKWIKKTDIRKEGSGNAGATNFARKTSFNAGMLISFLDWTKVVFLTLFAYILKKKAPGMEYISVEFISIGCFIGHIFPIFFNFKGGKGVSSFLGILMSFNIVAGLMIVVIFWVIVLITDKISIGSISVSFIAIFISMIPWINHGIMNTMMNKDLYWLVPSILTFVAITITILHHQNIKRLIKGNESSFKKTVLKK